MLIKNTYKSRAIVIWDTKHYISEANRQLDVVSNYKKLVNEPTVTQQTN